MLIKNAKIYGNKPADVRVEKGLIAEIGANLTPKGANKDEVFDAKNLTLLPSFIDLNVSLKNEHFSIENLRLLEEKVPKKRRLCCGA